MTADRFAAFQRGMKVADVDGIRMDDRHLYIDRLLTSAAFVLDLPFEFRGQIYQINSCSTPHRQAHRTSYTSVCAINLSGL
jgi:hypothetical protein